MKKRWGKSESRTAPKNSHQVGQRRTNILKEREREPLGSSLYPPPHNVSIEVCLVHVSNTHEPFFLSLSLFHSFLSLFHFLKILSYFPCSLNLHDLGTNFHSLLPPSTHSVSVCQSFTQLLLPPYSLSLCPCKTFCLNFVRTDKKDGKNEGMNEC